MTTYLVTGGAGYIGSQTVKALAAAGHHCIVFDNLSTGHRDFVRWGPLVEGDIRNADALDTAFTDYKIDAVIHFAALAYVGESMQHAEAYHDVNVTGTRVLLDGMRKARVDKLVFSSSCAVYGVQTTDLITENHPLKPINPYGATKLACEELMAEHNAAHGLQSVCLRYFNAAGADPDGEVGEHHEPETHLMPLVIDAAAGRIPSVEVFGTDYDTPDGTAVRDYTHVADLAAAHVQAATYLRDGGASTALNLGTGAGASVRQIIQAVEDMTGATPKVDEKERRPGDPPKLIADASLASDVLQWRPKFADLDTMVEHAWRWRNKRFSSESDRS